MTDRWGKTVWSTPHYVGETITPIIPCFLPMAIFLVLALGVCWLVRGLVIHVARGVGFDRHTERWGLGASMRRAGILRSPAETLGILCSWAIFVLFAGLG